MFEQWKLGFPIGSAAPNTNATAGSRSTAPPKPTSEDSKFWIWTARQLNREGGGGEERE